MQVAQPSSLRLCSQKQEEIRIKKIEERLRDKREERRGQRGEG
jgi:hypothetical protein